MPSSNRDPFAAYHLRRERARRVASGCHRTRLASGKVQQGRPAQRGPVALGQRQPEHPAGRPFRKRRSAERHQRPGRSLRARHGRDRHRPGQRCAALSRSARQRHSRLPAETAFGDGAARFADAGAGGFRTPRTARMEPSKQPRLDRDRRHPRRRRRVHAGNLAELAFRRQQDADRSARSRHSLRNRRAGARSRAGPRPDRCDRQSEPDRRPVHRTRHDPRARQSRDPLGGGADQFAR